MFCLVAAGEAGGGEGCVWGSYEVTVLTMETVGNSGGVRLEVFLGNVQGERNGWQQDNHW